MAEEAPPPLILGLDLGATSVGWALIGSANGVPAGIVRAGSRIFDADRATDIKAGRDKPRGQERREARLQRRQIWRRARRAREIFWMLQGWGILPPGASSQPEQRQELLNQLDRQILGSAWFKQRSSAQDIPEPQQVMPYLLRASALDEPLEPFFLGRALYHLAQRRGFLSNRKEVAPGKKEKTEEEGEVKKSIGELREKMTESGARTLGEYFSRQRPSGEKRIRQRWTARAMYEEEFEKIWAAQADFRQETFTAARKKLLWRAIFFQRKIKFPENLVGKCELEPGKRRAPKYLLPSQRFRLLQGVNNLRVSPPGEVERPLASGERDQLVEALEVRGDMKFHEIRKLLGLHKSCRFNLESEGEDRLLGNRTAAKLGEALGERWQAMTPAERNGIVEYLWSFEKADKLAGAAAKKWGLDPETAEKLAQVAFEADYMNVSTAAMRRLLPLLEAGRSFAEARKELYPEKSRPQQPLDWLPPVQKSRRRPGWEERSSARHAWGRDVRNPIVVRCLSEVRKVVNAIIRTYGKPTEIRIELARDLRNTRRQRKNISKRNWDNRSLREQAEQKITDEIPGFKPSRRDILKVRLAEECHWCCPYTGKSISMTALVGPESQFDIEHILPYAKFLDDSFANVTLCEAEHNRNVKQRRAPSEAYGGNPELYEQIKGRVAKFSGPMAKEKLRRFRLTPAEIEEELKEFSSHLLNDTRYATRLAADYLGLLYGGGVDEARTRRIHATSGRVTAILRGEWGLNSILADGATEDGGERPKYRGDHRHHAVDAIVTALTDDGTIQMLNRAAERAPSERRRRFASIESPWNNFGDSVRREIEKMVVSHRVSKRVRGPLHEETIYSWPIPIAEKAKAKRGKPGVTQEYRVHKPLAQMSAQEAKDIADPAVRELVQKKLEEVGGEPKKVFSNEANLPFFSKEGRRVLVRGARVRKRVPVSPLGEGFGARYVTRESNHHVEIFADLDRDGREIEWNASVVSLMEAYRRKRAHEPVVRTSHGPQTEFQFSLAPGEVIECEDEEKGSRRLLLVRGCTQLSAGAVQIFLAPIEDARLKKEQVDDGAYLRPASKTLRRWKARKVRVTPLGDVMDAHD
ncbi:MAG TPA: type II CRISPR RNA-guided endonuclease Cas9 [Candidatus Acidoferrum sp.]|nr:type II CRISPR RNA-guided endonuclease Cas9 [Candidatus Acidoferrum sp.]